MITICRETTNCVRACEALHALLDTGARSPLTIKTLSSSVAVNR
jgi:hypothetical protein